MQSKVIFYMYAQMIAYNMQVVRKVRGKLERDITSGAGGAQHVARFLPSEEADQ